MRLPPTAQLVKTSPHDSRQLCCPNHPRYKALQRPRARDCPWCAQLYLLATEPSSTGIYRHKETGRFMLMKYIEEAPQFSLSGLPRMHVTEWGTGAELFAPVHTFERVIALAHEEVA